jgi:hypothetical protein
MHSPPDALDFCAAFKAFLALEPSLKGFFLLEVLLFIFLKLLVSNVLLSYRRRRKVLRAFESEERRERSEF